MTGLDWWMYHGDGQHTGAFFDNSIPLNPSTAKFLRQLPPIVLPNTQSTKGVPAIVSGQAYVGTTSAAGGGNLFRINLTTGNIEATFTSPTPPSKYPDGTALKWPLGHGVCEHRRSCGWRRLLCFPGGRGLLPGH